MGEPKDRFPAGGRGHRRADRRRPLVGQLDAAFRSIKGVADRTVARLMAEIPEPSANGCKPPKVTRIALAHKLLVRLNAKARDLRTRLATSTQLIPQS